MAKSIPNRNFGVISSRNVNLSEPTSKKLQKMSETIGQDISYCIKLFIMESDPSALKSIDTASNAVTKAVKLSAQAAEKVTKISQDMGISDERVMASCVEQGLERYREEWEGWDK